MLLRLQSNRLHNGHVMGTEESGRYGEVGVLYDNFLGEYMFFFVLSSCLLYPIVLVIQSYILYRDKIHKKLKLCHESKC